MVLINDSWIFVCFYLFAGFDLRWMDVSWTRLFICWLRCIRLFICWLEFTWLLYIVFCLLFKLNYIFDSLNFASTRSCPRVCGYPQIAGTGTILYPRRVAGAGAGTSLGARVWVCEVTIRVDFTLCHLDWWFVLQKSI